MIDTNLEARTTRTPNPTSDLDQMVSLLERAIQPKRTGRKRTPRAGLQALRALSADSWPLVARWIFDWFCYLLGDRKVSLSTVRRYAAEVVDDVLVSGFNIDFSQFDAVHFESFYQRALDRAHRRKDVGYKASRLDDLHAFGVATYDFPRLPEPINKQSNASHVRAIIISEGAFVTGRDRLLESTEYDEGSRNCLWALLTVLHRTGLRRGDALTLRLCDLDEGQSFWLRVLDNEYADTKRSMFRVPLTALLLPSERDRVHAFLYDRLESGDRDHSLVFHPSGTPDQPWNENEFSRLYASYIRCNETGVVHTPHDSRHTLFSQLQLVVEGLGYWIERLTPFSEEHASEIRSAILPATPAAKNHYWSLAALASHTSPQTTLSNYLHYTGLVTHESIKSIRSLLSPNQLRNLGNSTLRTVRRWAPGDENADDRVRVDTIDAALSFDLTPYVAGGSSINSLAAATHDVPALYEPFKRSIADIEVAYKALTRYFANTPQEVITRTLGITGETLSDWIENCEFIATMPTRKRRSGALRHISSSRAKDGQTPRMPSRPKHRLEKKLLPKLYACVEQALESTPGDLRSVCQLWLTRSTVTNSGLPIADPSILETILKIFKKPLPARSWRLKLRIPGNCDERATLKEWQCHPNLKIELLPATKRQRQVKGWLYLRHPDEEVLTSMTKIAIRRSGEKERVPAKFSASVLRYLFFMACVVLFKPDDVWRMADCETDETC